GIARERRAAADDVDAPAEPLNAAARGCAQAVAKAIDAAAELVVPRDDKFRRRGRRWRTDIGDEVRDRDISFVADGRDHRHPRLNDRARDDLFVERPQILDRSTAAADD